MYHSCKKLHILLLNYLYSYTFVKINIINIMTITIINY